uniref:FdtA domain-containing protein n=1 Tax=Strongyloides papillosus TaxID=174720 RepID=A0A0N5BR25_STREA
MSEAKVNDFEEIFYLKFGTTDMNLRLDKFTIDGNNFPLILCPYENWVSVKSATEFILYEGSGIEFTNLHGAKFYRLVTQGAMIVIFLFVDTLNIKKVLS